MRPHSTCLFVLLCSCFIATRASAITTSHIDQDITKELNLDVNPLKSVSTCINCSKDHDHDSPIQSSRNTTIPNVRLRLTSDNMVKTTDLYFHDNCSRGLDPGYDASIFGSPNDAIELYSFLVENDQGVPMAVQCLNTNDLNEVSIPLGIHAQQGTQIEVSIDYSNLEDSVDIILENNSVSTLLNNNSFTVSVPSTLTGSSSYNLIFNTQILGLNNSINKDLSIKSIKNKTLVVDGFAKNQTKIRLLDLNGRVIYHSELISGIGHQTIDLNHITTGTYIVQLNTLYHTLNQQIILHD